VDRCAIESLGRVRRAGRPTDSRRRGEDALGRHDEQRLRRRASRLGALMSERDEVGQLGLWTATLAADATVTICYRRQSAIGPRRGRAARAPSHGRGHWSGLGSRGGVRGGGGGAASQAADQYANSSGRGQMLECCPRRVSVGALLPRARHAQVDEEAFGHAGEGNFMTTRLSVLARRRAQGARRTCRFFVQGSLR